MQIEIKKEMKTKEKRENGKRQTILKSQLFMKVL